MTVNKVDKSADGPVNPTVSPRTTTTTSSSRRSTTIRTSSTGRTSSPSSFQTRAGRDAFLAAAAFTLTRPILAGMAASPLIPATWQGALKLLLFTLDAVTVRPGERAGGEGEELPVNLRFLSTHRRANAR